MDNRKKGYILIILIIMCLPCPFSLAAAAAGEPSSTDMETVAETESVTTGAELIKWLEAHKNTGGMVKLADNVVLDGYYCYCPNAANTPEVFVDTDGYSITIAGEAEFWSVHNLKFSGAKDIFHVADGGLLMLSSVMVESGQYALWQEEGAGLVVDNCQISGDIHYADMPFVLNQDADYACAIVEKGQTAADVLVPEIKCTVNFQGQVRYHETVAVSWRLEGTEEQQERRLRFLAPVSVSDAAVKEPLYCTVVYNDYPLTFTEVKAVDSGSLYLFRGGYTKPEESLPITVIFEYSFDGTDWKEFEKRNVSHASQGFFIGITKDEWDTAKNPFVYIRLQWQDGETPYFSNVLRYAAGDLGHAEDQGGNRGGGTSIVNPPNEPQEYPLDKLPRYQAEELQEHPSGGLQRHLSDGAQERLSSGLSKHLGDEPQECFAGEPRNNLEKSSLDNKDPETAEPGSRTDIPSGSAASADIEPSAAESAESADETFEETGSGTSSEPTVSESVYGGSGSPSSPLQVEIASVQSGRGNIIMLAAGFAALSVVGGTAAFCLRTGIFCKLWRSVPKKRRK